MSSDPERWPIALPEVAWLGVADWLQIGGHGVLAKAIRTAVNGRRLSEEVVMDLTGDEREQVLEVLMDPG